MTHDKSATRGLLDEFSMLEMRVDRMDDSPSENEEEEDPRVERVAFAKTSNDFIMGRSCKEITEVLLLST